MRRTVPRLRERFWLRRTTIWAARREADYGHGHTRRMLDGTTAPAPAPYQERVVTRLNHWIDLLARGFRPAQEACLRRIQAAADRLAHLLEELDANAEHIPNRLVMGDLHQRLLPVVVITELVQIAALWQLVEDLPLPLALLTAIAIALTAATIAVICGMAAAALVLDEREGPHELAPRHRTMWAATTIGSAMLVLIGAAVLAVARGNVLLWLALALIVACIEAVWGASLYEARHIRERRALQRRCGKVLKQGRRECVSLVTTREAAMGSGRNAVGHARGILRDGEVAYGRRHARANWRRRPPLPSIPRVDLPEDTRLEQRMLIPIATDMQEAIALFDGITPAAVLPRDRTPRGQHRPLGQLPPAA